MSVHPKAFSSIAQRLERARAGHGALSSRPSRLIITFHIKIPKRKPALIKATYIYWPASLLQWHDVNEIFMWLLRGTSGTLRFTCCSPAAPRRSILVNFNDTVICSQHFSQDLMFVLLKKSWHIIVENHDVFCHMSSCYWTLMFSKEPPVIRTQKYRHPTLSSESSIIFFLIWGVSPQFSCQTQLPPLLFGWT